MREEMKPEPQILALVPYEHALLRQIMPPVTFPLSIADQQLIENMKFSIQRAQLKKANAPFEGAAGMAANQWGQAKRIFVFCPFDEKEFEIIINPSYQPLEDEKQSSAETLDWEGCFSLPFCTGKVRRYLQVRASYQKEDGSVVDRILSGWEARVFQHETDHLNGILYDDALAKKCVEKHQFSSKQELMMFYRDLRAE